MKRVIAALCLLSGWTALEGQVLIRVRQGGLINQVANGGTVVVNGTGVGQAKTLDVIITYLGSTSLTLQGSPVMLGSQDFTVTAAPATGTTLTANQSALVQVTYTPGSGLQSMALLDYAFQQASVQTVPTTSNPNPTFIPPVPGLVEVGFSGTTPDYLLNYVLALDNNVMNLPRGGVLPFTDTPVNSATTATMVLVNLGSGSGQVNSVSVTGEAFSLASLPFLPGTLAAGGNLQFLVRFIPRQAGPSSGSLTVQFENGATYTVQLRGAGISSYLSYELVPTSGAVQSIVPGQVVAMPATAVGEKSKMWIRVSNHSGLDLTVSRIAVSGDAYALSEMPFLALKLSPGQMTTFALTFAPLVAGRQAGRLQVGDDLFDLQGDAAGPILSYSYKNPAGTNTVQALGTVLFPEVMVGQSAPVEFTIRNTGTAPAPLVSISVVSAGKAVFTLVNPPTLPAALAPDTALTFRISFAPLTTGQSTASLRVNTDAFVLSGNATVAQPVPDYSIGGPVSVNAFEQPAVSLTLASPYALDLTGSLTLSSESDSFVADPSVLFATGGKTANFTIAAGSTKAVFSNGATELKFQTGSVAGTLLVTPAFATKGGFDLTPESPKRLKAVLAGSAPKLLQAAVSSLASNGFTLQVAGYSTTRTLAKATVSFKLKAGYSANLTEFTQDISTSGFLWFASTSSAAYGGQFLATIPITLGAASAGSTISPVQGIESVTVTISNEKGVSSAITAPVQ